MSNKTDPASIPPYLNDILRKRDARHNQVKRTIEPHLPLEDMIIDWNEISKSLAEAPRNRKT